MKKSKIPWKDVLVFNRLNGKLESPSRLRRAMIESGIALFCTKCQISHGLYIHHINGDLRNNRQANLEFLCTKCHPKPPRKRKPESFYSIARRELFNKMRRRAIKDIQEEEDKRVFAALDAIANGELNA